MPCLFNLRLRLVPWPPTLGYGKPEACRSWAGIPEHRATPDDSQETLLRGVSPLLPHRNGMGGAALPSKCSREARFLRKASQFFKADE